MGLGHKKHGWGRPNLGPGRGGDESSWDHVLSRILKGSVQRKTGAVGGRAAREAAGFDSGLKACRALAAPQVLRVLVRHALECRANLVLVAPNPPEPCPAWRASTSRHVWKVKPLADEFCADRVHGGWESVLLPGHGAFFVSFE